MNFSLIPFTAIEEGYLQMIQEHKGVQNTLNKIKLYETSPTQQW